MHTTYYHGTRILAAIEALSAGGPLLPRRPRGASRFARSRADAVYLTPCFNQASEYAYLGHDRRDWPGAADVALGAPHVFAFTLPDGQTGLPCEDELGWAAKHALLRVRGERAESTMNVVLATALDDAPDILDALAEAAGPLVGRLRADPDLIRHWTGGTKTRLGRMLADTAPAELLRRVTALGASISLPGGPTPVAGYRLDRRVMRAEDAVPVPLGGNADPLTPRP